MKEIVIASNNKHKVKEIKQLIGEYFDKIYSLKELNIDVEIEETGSSFYENALIKAKAISQRVNMQALADDSGLMVEYLDGKPGVYSARFAGAPSDDKKNNQLLIQKLKGIKNRKACFKTCIVIFNPKGEIISAEGITEGEILEKEVGNNGFGYDPLFYSYDLCKSFGVATEEEKNAVSHRSRALKAIQKKLK